MNHTLSSQRIVWLDAVRLVALFTVVCCHCTDTFNFIPPQITSGTEELKFWGAVYGALLRPCVPLFVMITGALLLPVRQPAGPFYRKRISRVFWPFLIWSILYALFPWFTGIIGCEPDFIRYFFPYSSDDILRQSFDVSLTHIGRLPLNFSPVGVHMWYIYMLIGLYLYLPIFSAWVEKASERAKLWFLAAWAVTTLLPYYVQLAEPYLWGTCSWNLFGMLYYFAGFNGYLLLGHYLRHHDFPLGRTLAFGVPLFAVGYAVTFFGFRHVTSLPEYSEELLELFFTYCSLNVVMMTVPVFLLLKHVNIRSAAVQRLLAHLTACGFGIYMVHYFFAGPCVHLTRALGCPLPLQLPLAAAIALGVSWIVVAALRRIAGRRSIYLIG